MPERGYAGGVFVLAGVTRIGRAAIRTVLVCLLVALASVAAGCGGPETVSLEDLAVEMDRYDGERVATHGVVAEFGGDGDVERYFVLQDQHPNRVRLVPTSEAEPHVRSMVKVVGTFEFDPARGRLIRIDTVEPVAPDQ